MRDMIRKPIAPAEVVSLCNTWLAMGNRWDCIAQKLGKGEYWLKREWKKLLKAEGVDIATTKAEVSDSTKDRIKSIAGKYEEQAAKPHDSFSTTMTKSRAESFSSGQPQWKDDGMQEPEAEVEGERYMTEEPWLDGVDEYVGSGTWRNADVSLMLLSDGEEWVY